MMRYDARIAMEEELQALGLFRGKEVNKMRLGLCSRTGDIIEPMLTPQWCKTILFLQLFIEYTTCKKYLSIVCLGMLIVPVWLRDQSTL